MAGPGSPVGTVVLGEALIDIVTATDGTRQEHVGGSPANVAIGLAQLGHPCSLATWIGTDERGTRIVDHLRSHGVSLTDGSTGADRTPTALARLTADGTADYEFDLDWNPPAPTVSPGTHVHTGSIAATLQPGASTVLDLISATRDGGTVSYDPNLRPSIMGEPHDVRSLVEERVGRADVVKASDEDLAWLYAGAPVEEIAHLWGLLGPTIVVVTRGDAGALLHLTGSDQDVQVPAESVTVADTVGAGDSFMAGLLSGLLEAGLLGGVEHRQALRSADAAVLAASVSRGIATAAWTVQRSGAAAPSRADLGL